MTVRRRILLAALTLVVVATLIVVALPSGGESSPPKLSFTLCGYTNGAAKFAIVTITNWEGCAVSLERWYYQAEGKYDLKRVVTVPGPTKVAGRQFCTISFELPVYHARLDPPERWRITATARRETLSNKLRLKLRRLPWIGRRVDLPASYHITTQLFHP